MQTLLVGGDPRPGTRHVDAQGLEGLVGSFREILVQADLTRFVDPWALLRRLHSVTAPGGVLTVVSAFRSSSTEALLRLAHFDLLAKASSRQSSRAHVYRARPVDYSLRRLTCSVIVPCLNEEGNVQDAVRRMPSIGSHTELIFVDGGSTDATVDRIQSLIRNHGERDIKCLVQRNEGGKARAVFQGFDAATGDVLIILDADLTVAPEDLPRFFLALAEGVARFANGNRLAFSMEAGAMPPANLVGNRVFAAILSRLTGSTLGDTLCGTKALYREDWHNLRRVRARFGGHDPWGDFDLILGAAELGLPIVDVPIRYYARTFGESKMRPFTSGAALARTCAAAFQSRVARQR